MPFSIHHIDELLQDLDLELPWHVRTAQWLRTVKASDFMGVWPRFVAQAKAARSKTCVRPPVEPVVVDHRSQSGAA